MKISIQVNQVGLRGDLARAGRAAGHGFLYLKNIENIYNNNIGDQIDGFFF